MNTKQEREARAEDNAEKMGSTPGKRRVALRGLSDVVSGNKPPLKRDVREQERAAKIASKAPAETAAQATLRANAAKHKAEEAAAKKSNDAVLQANKANAKPEPKAVLKVGSGSAIGVASGAMDGQPHTKLAVEQARIAERANAKAQGLIEARTSMGQIVYVKRGDPLCRQVDGTLVRFPDAATVAKFDKLLKQWLDHKAGLTEWPRGMGPTPRKDKPKAAPKVKPVPPKRVAAPAVDRAYTKGERKNEAREGTWTRYMLEVILKHKTTVAAQAALVTAGGEFGGRRLDFKWADAKGYIKLK